MAWTKGFNFRSTSGFVTDAADDTYVLTNGSNQGEQYPTTRNSVTFGYTSLVTLGDRDRNAGNNAKLAGIHFPDTEANETIFRVDLPATGNYRVRLAMGDPDNASTGQKVLIRDNGSTLATITGDAAANSFRDATGTELTHN